ncbi:hypothetical protein BD413DRAFT_592302 [Trametes elegans]|nr:hypothetical protein BD413DRAFT_592302 [Trametes elegans]
MSLDARGIISIVVIVMYIPILIAGTLLSFRNGFARHAGWIFLVILSIIRLVGAITHILSEQDATNVTARTIYGIMEAAGLSPLLMATLGFMRTTIQYGLDEKQLVSRGLRLGGIVALVGLVLGIVAGTQIGSASKQSDLDSANTLRHASSILYVAALGVAFLITAYCWMNRHVIYKYRKRLLTGISLSLPFLLVRVVYGVLSSFAPSPFTIRNGQVVPLTFTDSGLAKFSSGSSDWGIYLAMSVLTEYIAILIYAAVGIATPLGRDQEVYQLKETEQGFSASSSPAYAPMTTQQPRYEYAQPNYVVYTRSG